MSAFRTTFAQSAMSDLMISANCASGALLRLESVDGQDQAGSASPSTHPREAPMGSRIIKTVSN
jgi:hypothetical protein